MFFTVLVLAVMFMYASVSCATDLVRTFKGKP